MISGLARVLQSSARTRRQERVQTMTTDYDELVDMHGEEAVEIFVETFGAYQSDEANREYAEETFEEAYLGEWDSLEEYVENYLEDTGALRSVPKDILPYIDFASYARDMETNGELYSERGPSGKLHVFYGSF